MTLGQSFEAYTVNLEGEVEQLTHNANLFLEVNMGATAIGTGINADPDYSRKVIGHLRDVTGLDILLARNLVEATIEKQLLSKRELDEILAPEHMIRPKKLDGPRSTGKLDPWIQGSA